MSELEIVAGAGRSSQADDVLDLVSARQDAEPLLRRMLAAGDLLAVAAAAVLVGFFGSGATGSLLLVLCTPSSSSWSRTSSSRSWPAPNAGPSRS